MSEETKGEDLGQAGGPLDEEAFEFEEADVDDAFVHMGRIVEELQQHPDTVVRQRVFELLDWVEAFHREAVVRISEQLPAETLAALKEDPVVAHLFDTYMEEGEPEDLEALLDDALDEIRPYVHSHGGEMEVLGVGDGIVRLRLMGSCHGCPSSMVTLTQGVEKILKEKWPAFRKIEVEGAEEAKPKKLLQIQKLHG